MSINFTQVKNLTESEVYNLISENETKLTLELLDNSKKFNQFVIPNHITELHLFKSNISKLKLSSSNNIQILSIRFFGYEDIKRKNLDLSRFVNLLDLTISSSHIKKLYLPPNIQKLTINVSFIKEKIHLNNQLLNLKYSGSDLIITEYPKSLRRLDVSDNSLIQLPALPSNLEYLDCSNNKISYLYLPDTLKTLICNNNSLYKITDLPHNLEHLDFSHNNVYEVGLPETL